MFAQSLIWREGSMSAPGIALWLHGRLMPAVAIRKDTMILDQFVNGTNYGCLCPLFHSWGVNRNGFPINRFPRLIAGVSIQL
jgi:hypothetical protein